MLQEYDTPTDVLQNGDYTPVPIMFGSNSHEGSFIHAELYNDFLLGNDLVNDTDFWTHEYMIDLLRYRKPTVLDRSNKPRGGGPGRSQIKHFLALTLNKYVHVRILK